MADYNPDISNGTCYYYDGMEADSRYIPCGNAALGHKSCCESLDMCLSSHACYNGQYGVTYLAGCTDSSYDDPVCPDKGEFQGQQWAGLVYCNGTSNEWVACEDEGSTVTTPSPCWCPDTDSRTVAFTDSSVLTNIMSLPATLGGSVTWKDADAYSSEHSLTSTLDSSDTDTTTSTSISNSVTSATVLMSPASTSSAATSTLPLPSTSFQTFSAPAATSTVTPGDSGLSTGQKIGISFGAVGGAAIALVFAWLLCTSFRRRAKRRQKEKGSAPMREPTLPQVERRPSDAEMRSPAWSGHKSELPADESVTNASPAPRYQDLPTRPQSAEVEGSPVRMSPTRPTQDGGLRVPGRKGTYYEMAG
ncbi:uncharacterized protein Z520_09048 [Fonsecaea multimorphosa CBS 102226]|uniref:Uncharacterized protein n=1 Tax=Fonsecaea multimorphosa CBS 102226 TaxID=1442371 RepID=A0A0D2JP53_9EURO|nr:uncharacterized protein Z520_09048 [Fonsecaea multimorphosa CBS 102226]KIX95132.1 hypothetical protein Z520_09048 [Fonsecaea multimorphosa CBS 102226]OAL20853.1 hypothetical protein AYO22_08481 [Fonsecaea multimorphosa]